MSDKDLNNELDEKMNGESMITRKQKSLTVLRNLRKTI